MSDDTRVKMYPELLSDNSFKLPEDISQKMKDIYEMIDVLPSDVEEAEIILDEYNAGFLKAIEEIIATPLGVLNETLLRMLEEVHTNMMINYDAASCDNTEDSVETSRLPQQDPIVVERVMTEITRKTVPTETIDDTDISDEDMLSMLPD